MVEIWTQPSFILKQKESHIWEKKTYGKSRFHTFQDALDKVEQFATALECDVPITFEPDATFAFFGNGTRIATWICGDEEDDLLAFGIHRKTKPKKGHLRKEKEWNNVIWRI